MTKFFVTIFAILCLVAIAFAQDPTEASSTDAPATTTQEASTDAPATTTQEASSEAPEPTTTSTSDVTTASADDKYTTACKEQFADKENVTAVQITVGPFSSCTYQCASITQTIKRGVFQLEVLEYLGKPANKEDHAPCAPNMECLKGTCNIGSEVHACLDANADVFKIQDSKKNKCKKSCVGKDKKEVAEVNGNEGQFCWATKEGWSHFISLPGTCKSGKCDSMI